MSAYWVAMGAGLLLAGGYYCITQSAINVIHDNIVAADRWGVLGFWLGIAGAIALLSAAVMGVA